MIKETVCQLEIKLDTGRTHQIRVHLAEIGHPVMVILYTFNVKTIRT